MQDPNPNPWGAENRFQAHFIVRKDPGRAVGNFLARTKLQTQGHFASKTVSKVQWNGSGSLAERLNEDDELNDMIAKQSVKCFCLFLP